MQQREINYTARIAAIFLALGLLLTLFFTRDYEYAGAVTNYAVALLLIVSVLAFVYFMMKFFFYINAHHNESEELHLKDLPKDQEDISHEH